MKVKVSLYTILLTVIVLCVCSCRNKSHTVGESSSLQEAKLLSIVHENGYTRVEITNPWDTTSLLHTYLLVPSSRPVPGNLPRGTVVRTPLKRALVYSSVHSSVLRELGAGDAVRGVCDAQYFNDSIITAGLTAGTITDCGNSMQPTVEKVISMKPDAILLSPYQDATYGQITKLNVPIIECADYMEYTPLGRAEWIKFYGELVEQRALADSIYNQVKQQYNQVKETVASKKLKRPLVLTENLISGIWNVPGGQSYMAQYIKDAGGDYPWADDKNTGSLTLDFNQVLARAQKADYWLLKSPSIHSLADLKSSYTLNDQFEAYKTGNVYVCDTNTTRFFDRFPFHPEVATDYQLQFFVKASE